MSNIIEEVPEKADPDQNPEEAQSSDQEDRSRRYGRDEASRSRKQRDGEEEEGDPPVGQGPTKPSSSRERS